MSLIEKYKQFKKRRHEKAIANNLKTLQNPKALKEERVAAIEFFKHIEDAETSINSLLKRFNYSLEHGINDTREKESAMEGILAFETNGLQFIQEHLKISTKIAWPIKILKSIASEEQIVSTLQECLNFADVEFDQNQIDKNYDILCYLRDYQIEGKLCESLFHFLEAHDERLRFAVVEVLLEQSHDFIPAKLEKFLLDESPENSRIRQSVIKGFVDHKWTLPSKNNFKVGPFLPGYSINKSYNLISSKP